MVAVVHILIPAAGSSARMRGVDKLVQPVHGKPLIRHVAKTALGTGAPVVVTLPLGALALKQALDRLRLTIVPVPDAVLGMSRSLVRGVRALSLSAGPEDGVMVLPADMPGFTSLALADLIARFRQSPDMIQRATSMAGQPGHPTILPHTLWPELEEITGDQGGRALLQRHADRVHLVPLPGDMAVVDLDTPEDWAAWRAGGA